MQVYKFCQFNFFKLKEVSRAEVTTGAKYGICKKLMPCKQKALCKVQ